jgi:hypothetical protein
MVEKKKKAGRKPIPKQFRRNIRKEIGFSESEMKLAKDYAATQGKDVAVVLRELAIGELKRLTRTL